MKGHGLNLEHRVTRIMVLLRLSVTRLGFGGGTVFLSMLGGHFFPLFSTSVSRRLTVIRMPGVTRVPVVILLISHFDGAAGVVEFTGAGWCTHRWRPNSQVRRGSITGPQPCPGMKLLQGRQEGTGRLLGLKERCAVIRTPHVPQGQEGELNVLLRTLDTEQKGGR